MSFTYDVTTERGRVRLLIGDTDSATADNQLFADAEIDAFLSLGGADVRLAAAQALEALAASQVMILKVIRILDLQLDGAAVARELRLQAGSLRQQVADGVADSGDLWAVVEMVPDVFAARERLGKQWIRGLT